MRARKKPDNDSVTLHLELGEKIAAVVGAVVGILSLLLLAGSIDDARNASRIDNRAWLGVKQFDLSAEPAAGAKLTVQVTLLAIGNTPALDSEVKAQVAIIVATARGLESSPRQS